MVGNKHKPFLGARCLVSFLARFVARFLVRFLVGFLPRILASFLKLILTVEKINPDSGDY